MDGAIIHKKYIVETGIVMDDPVMTIITMILILIVKLQVGMDTMLILPIVSNTSIAQQELLRVWFVKNVRSNNNHGPLMSP